MLGALTMLTSAFNAQSSVVYVGDGGKFFVSGKALVYSGGNWKVNSEREKTVENKGNVIIVGDYKKGATANAAQDGKEFVNVYTAGNDYGQVKFLRTPGTSDARMTVERPAASSGYDDSWFPISLPYKDNADYLMKSFGLELSAFSDGARYTSTILKWNNNTIALDPVAKASQLTPGDYYNLNMVGAPNVRAKMENNIPYKGTPNGTVYTQRAEGRSIHGLSTQQFSDLGYNDWKLRLNRHQETYESYMGRANSTSKVLNKNIFRFGNPYTSNLDLSEFDGANAWVKILNKGGHTIKQAYDAQLIKDFSVTKRMDDYNTQWGLDIEGSITTSRKYYTAKFDGQRWTGNAEALLIRPTETFNLNFPVINPTAVGSRVLNIEVNFTDAHKTFEYTPSAKNTTSPGLIASVFNFDNNPTGIGTMLAKDISYNNIQTTNFYQLEVILSKNNTVQSSPAYIVGANYYKESGANASSNDKVFVYGVKDGAVAYNSKKEFNEFNSDTYVGKPLGLGFNNLENGQTYQLQLALYEGSIFNKVDALKNGAFYLKDNVTNKVTLVNPKDVITFVADANADKRFEFYWKQAPQIANKPAEVKVEEPVVNTTTAAQSTVIYKEGGLNKVRFENISNVAKVEVFSIAGRLVSSKEGVSTHTDYTLNLGTEGMYMVRVVYQNGEVRTLKVVNN